MELKEFSDMPDDNLINGRCFVCGEKLDYTKEFLSFERMVEVNVAENETKVLDCNPILEICSKKCYKKFAWIVSIEDYQNHNEEDRKLYEDYCKEFPDSKRSFWSIINKSNNLDREKEK